ncbi:hypothetical protein A2442_02535 [Candidatus Campbellbacteria bacterium RIFOXYC2_FULL_35_25]|uniref:Phospholipase C/D domain-containing protein n=1 Tax=Candidatus Campbellbacteria bacterium RIFOXYC2_FULL_35_25 TaxID=1797582 RepID=A0A1F5EHW1_9BACT|nr:MAG: hypothetical protein A2442_02535 [Candidatus Campbellbacteria bacterium RIFOXYC2_FULL_35_25]
MKTQNHILVAPLLISMPYLFSFSSGATIIAIASNILIDIDHLQLIFKEKAFSFSKIKNLYESIYDKHNHEKSNKAFDSDVFYLFHTIEFNVLLLALSLRFPFLMFVAIGFLFHILFDIIHHLMHHLPIRWLFLINWLRNI